MSARFTYTGHVYRNHGSTWTGWIKASTCTSYFKFISRAGYESREAAQGYVDRWLEKLAKKDPFTSSQDGKALP